VIDSIIDSLGFDIIQDNGVVAEDINVMNNTDFETYNIDQGSVEVHYKVRVKVVDGEGSNASGVIVNALGIDGEEYSLGITDISGLSNYAILEDVYILDKGGVAILDEFDTDLYPMMSEALLEMFFSKETNPKNAQLIFSAHNPYLLNLLDKYQIAFTRKRCKR